MAGASRALEPLLDHSMPGGRLRYFKSPAHAAHNIADMPWHSADDFLALTGLGEEAAKAVKRALRQDWNEPETAATIEGITVLSPHFMAEGFIAFLLDHLDIMAREDIVALRATYRRGMTECLKHLTAHLHPAEKLAFALAAMEQAEAGGDTQDGGRGIMDKEITGEPHDRP